MIISNIDIVQLRGYLIFYEISLIKKSLFLVAFNNYVI